jgi:renalase
MKVGIVGGGVAGLGAAVALRDAADVTILERRRSVGGRCETRERRGCTYDPAANYLKDPDGTVAALCDRIGLDPVDIEPSVRPFDGDGTIGPSDNAGAPKWTFPSGIAVFAERLLDHADASVDLDATVTAIQRSAGARSGTQRPPSRRRASAGAADTGGGGDEPGDDTDTDAFGEGAWQVRGGQGRFRGPFDALVLTPPGPQTADLLDSAAWDDPRADRLAAAAGAVSYRPIRTLALHYPFRVQRDEYALVLDDGTHPVGWVSREECKPSRVPDGESLLIVQMHPDWSRDHLDEPTSAAADAAAAAVADLLDDDRLREYDWVDDASWRHALPNDGCEAADVRQAEDAGLFLAGDWIPGRGRVAAALESGVSVGERIAERAG